MSNEPDFHSSPVQAPQMAMSLEQAIDKLQAMRTEIGMALVGQDEVVEQVLVALLAGGHVLLEGVPGLGKTLLVRALAKTFDGSHGRIQFTPDLMPSDVIGHVMFDMQQNQFKVRRGPVFTHLLLADEINRAPAKTQAALLEAMQERQVTLEGRSMPLPEPFMTLATQNPVEQEGTYPLPEAQLDRFLLKVKMGYPSEAEENSLVKKVLLGGIGEAFDLRQVRSIMTIQEIPVLQAAVARIQVDQKVVEYAVKIVRSTRSWPGVAMGAGPRGTIALLRAGRALALLRKRDFVIPDDLKDMATAVLRHRLQLTPDMEIEGRSTDVVIGGILAHVEAPRV